MQLWCLKPHHNQMSGCRDINISLIFKKDVKYKNLSSLLDCNTNSVFPTSDSFLLVTSHIWVTTQQGLRLSRIFTCFVRIFPPWREKLSFSPSSRASRERPNRLILWTKVSRIPIFFMCSNTKRTFPHWTYAYLVDR